MLGWIVALSALFGVLLIAKVVDVEVRGGHVPVYDPHQFSTEFNQRLVEYMNANYQGNPLLLEQALLGFLPIARELAARQPEPVDDDTIRTLIVTGVTGERFARRDEVESALNSILRTDERKDERTDERTDERAAA